MERIEVRNNNRVKGHLMHFHPQNSKNTTHNPLNQQTIQPNNPVNTDSKYSGVYL